MAWYNKRKRRYYSRCYRVGDRVRSLYFGAGSAADLASWMVARRAVEQAAKAESWRQVEQLFDAAAVPSAALDTQVGVLFDATWLATGYNKRTVRHRWSYADARQ